MGGLSHRDILIKPSCYIFHSRKEQKKMTETRTDGTGTNYYT